MPIYFSCKKSSFFEKKMVTGKKWNMKNK